MSGYTDIRAGGWVARLPRGVAAYVLLARLDRPIGTWLLFLPGLWAICLAARGFGQGVRLVLLFGAGSLAMRAAGCVVNDLWDREMDAKVARTAGRPLASGALRPRQALVFLAVLLAAGLLILLALDDDARWLGVASLLLVALYPAAKRVTWWPQAVLGLTFGWGALLGYAAAEGRLRWAAGALYGGAILWTLGYDTIYAHQDREDDALIGVKSSARRLGEATRPFLAVVYGGMLVCLGGAMLAQGLRWWGVVALAPAAGLLAWQVWRLDIDDAAMCLRLFRANRDVGLLVAAAIMVGRTNGLLF